MKKIIFTPVFVLIVISMHAQIRNKDFETFARKQDSLCVKAYEDLNDKKYSKLLSAFLTRYDKLSENEKKDFSDVLTDMYYNFCCLYSLQNKKAEALNYFEKCVNSNFADYSHTLEDTDLDNIRNEDRYKSLIARVRSVGDYEYILKRGQKYNTADERSLPKFTYQAQDDPNLIALRRYFNLDSIAGTGNEVSKILNLLHWAHYLVPHDGIHGNPVVKNAMSMLEICKKEKRGLNCRGLATVLNECYLSLGIKSRFVTCLPKDSLLTDNDCHVINMVYSTLLKKWLWIDPTNDAYLMDETGMLLSVEEVRERLINKKPLILNPDANWNRKESVFKDHYLNYYMTKNLYRFHCPVNSEYDSETNSPNKKIIYIELLPLDYFSQAPNVTEKKDVETSTISITYKTNNPTLFWQAPGETEK